MKHRVNVTLRGEYGKLEPGDVTDVFKGDEAAELEKFGWITRIRPAAKKAKPESKPTTEVDDNGTDD